MKEVCAPNLNAQEFIRLLGLTPHPEGGWFRFTCNSGVHISQDALPAGYSGSRETCSLIYYLLQGSDVSRWHKLLSPEIWTWHAGGALLMTLGGVGERPAEEGRLLLGPRANEGEDFQAVVPAGAWQTTRILWGDFTLVSCIVSPAYAEDDFYMPVL